MIQVSIVIASTRRRGSLQRTVASCLAQRNLDPATLEIIVCDLSTHVSSGAMHRELVDDAARAGISFRYLRDPNATPTRNAGIEQAAGEFIALIEEGAEADPYWLERLRDCLECYDAEIVAGPVFPRFDDYSRPSDAGRRRRFAYDQRLPTGAPLRQEGGYGNCLVAKTLLQSQHAATQQGTFGEADFLRGQTGAGIRAVWCADALVHRSIDIAWSGFPRDHNDGADLSGVDALLVAASHQRSGNVGGSEIGLSDFFGRDQA